MRDKATATFPEHAKVVTRTLRKAFADVLTSVGADPGNQISISARTRLTKTLAWKISKIVQTDDPAVVFKQMPGGAGIRIFLEHAEKAGAPLPAIETARAAVTEYQRLIDVHSGDRESLALLGNTLATQDSRREGDELHRRQFYQGASAIWGAQARMHFKLSVLGPGAQPDLCDFATMTVLGDFRRLRPDVAWVMASRQMVNDDGSDMAAREEALDPKHDDPARPPIVEAFCSSPLPQLRRINDGNPTTHTFELVEGPVGNSAALTCAVGTITRGLPTSATPGNEWGGHISTSDIPAEWLLVDQFIHRSFSFAIPPTISLHGHVRFGPPELTDRTRLACALSSEVAEPGAVFLADPEMRGHGEVVRWVFDRAGWDVNEFHLYRTRIAYPPCPAALFTRYRLPGR